MNIDDLIWPSVPELVVSVWNENRDSLLEKDAEEHWLNKILPQLATLWQLREGKMLGVIPNAPGPVSSMLVGGLAGAGLGYGAGWLAEKILPEHWKRNNLRRTLATVGGTLGVMPGIGMAAGNLLANNPTTNPALRPGGDRWDPKLEKPIPEPRFNSGPAPMAKPTPPVKHPGWYRPYKWYEYVPKARPLDKPNTVSASASWEHGLPVPDERLPEEARARLKQSAMASGLFADMPSIDVNEFNEVVWKDPRVAGRLPVSTRAAASGVMAAAANLPGQPYGGSSIVTPLDIGRLAAGMGTGYVSGMLVGKALGSMMGLPESAQDTLKTTGIWAGAIQNLVPMLFGR